MRILYITAGAGAMYCGSCARDLALVRGLQRLGHDVTVMPLYTPLKADHLETVRQTPIHYGGINVYLQQATPALARLPSRIRNVLDAPTILKLAAGWGIKTKPQDLGPLTLSVLQGTDGRQSQELERLLSYIDSEAPFDMINITNSLLSGLIPPLRKRYDCGLVGTVQGEDLFLESMGSRVLAEARTLMRRNVRDLDLILATSREHAKKMTEFLGIAPKRMRVVFPGIEIDRPPSAPDRPRTPFVVAYLGAITPSKGLDLLIEACNELVLHERRDLRLRIAGRVLNPAYARRLRKQIRVSCLGDRVEWLGELSESQKVGFLHAASVVVCPTRGAEARGMVALEAMTTGRPVIVPSIGAFPEWIEITGGGLLVEPETPRQISEKLAILQDRPDYADALGVQAAASMRDHFDADRIADQVAEYYRKVLEGEHKSSNTTAMIQRKEFESRKAENAGEDETRIDFKPPTRET